MKWKHTMRSIQGVTALFVVVLALVAAVAFLFNKPLLGLAALMWAIFGGFAIYWEDELLAEDDRPSIDLQ